MKLKLVAAGSICLLLATGQAMAHHSGAMFERHKTVSLTGTVTSFEWTNPHSWLELDVAGAKGAKMKHWSIELNGPEALFKEGFRPDNPKIGDKIVVVAHPLKDGRPGGSVVSVTLANGKFIGIPST
jgi:hypothetical protein